MKSSSSARLWIARVLGTVVVASMLSVSSFAAFAQTPTPPAPPPTAQPAPAPAADAAARDAWRQSMDRLPFPKNGCFTASYPKIEWQEVECGRPSPYHNQGGKGAALNDAGDGNDYVAQASGAGLITSATGSFLTIPNVTEVSGVSGNVTQVVNGNITVDPNVNSVFMLQLNSQSPVNSSDGSTFYTPACNNAPSGASGCSGWQQFLFSQTQGPPPDAAKGQLSAAPTAALGNTPAVFVEYWLYNYGTPCPVLPAWALGGQPPGTLWDSDGAGDCVFNGPTSYVPPQTASDIPNMILKTTAGANADSLKLTTPTGMYGYQEPSVLNLSQAWTEAEFNVFGDCCRSTATFTSPTVLVVKTSIQDGTNTPPICVPNDGTTGEQNNLDFEPIAVPVCCPYGGASPAIEFMEALVTNLNHAASCGPTSLIGDPHITTADGTLYNFQSAGEFVSLRDPDGTEIQTRQTPIATTFFPGPDPHDGLATCVSINTAVAARVGEHRVTWEPNLSGIPDPSGLQLRIDGTLTSLGPQGLALGSGGRVVLAGGNGLEIDFPDGKTMLVSSWWWNSQAKWYLDVDISHLGLTVSGAGSVGRGIAGAIADGSWLPALPNGVSVGPMPATLPARYDVLYTTFADAWRVSDRDSLFDYAPGTSTDTFTMKDWPKQNPPCAVPHAIPAEPAGEAVAIAACQRVKDLNKRADCEFDVRASGYLGFAKTYLASQSILAYSTTTSLTDGDNPSQPGEWVAFTAVVAPYSSTATGLPSGTVQFAVDGANTGEPVTVDVKGRAKWETSHLKIGASRVTATYVPGTDSAFLPSTSLEKIHDVTRCPCGAAPEQK